MPGVKPEATTTSLPSAVAIWIGCGLTVMLATAAGKEDREALLERGDLKGQFDDGADADQVEESKPAPEKKPAADGQMSLMDFGMAKAG